MMSRALVTGAAGFIGSYIVDRLLKQGYEVIGIDNLVLGQMSNINCALENKKFSFLEIDLADYKAVYNAIAPIAQKGAIDFVWHMAANSDISAGIKDPVVDLRDTYMTTYNALAIMRDFEIPRIAFASSSAVYGDHQDMLTENTGPLFPISNYGAMKLASEASISAAVESFLERAWIFRFPNVIGKRSTHGVIYDFIRKLREDKACLEVLGNGTQCKSYLHVSELLDAMFFIVKNTNQELNYFNVGNDDDGATVEFIAKEVVNTSEPDADIRYGNSTKGWVGDVPKFRYSIKKLRALGWKPTLSSEDAVRRAIAEQLEE